MSDRQLKKILDCGLALNCSKTLKTTRRSYYSIGAKQFGNNMFFFVKRHNSKSGKLYKSKHGEILLSHVHYFLRGRTYRNSVLFKMILYGKPQYTYEIQALNTSSGASIQLNNTTYKISTYMDRNTQKLLGEIYKSLNKLGNDQVSSGVNWARELATLFKGNN